VVWLDGLDIPIVNFFCTSFAEHHPQQTQPVSKIEGEALHSFGMGLIPVEYKPESLSAPVFIYPFERSRGALEHLSKTGHLNPWHGIKLQYANPVTGGYPMPTIAAFLQKLPAGFQGQPYRSTDATVFCANEGAGRTFAGDKEMVWAKNDVFVVPSWQIVRHQAEEASVLFSFSDRVAQKALGLWREELL
jgi:gentisate 1,2-dioxygenase